MKWVPLGAESIVQADAGADDAISAVAKCAVNRGTMIGVLFEDGEFAGGGFVAGLPAGDGAVDADLIADHKINTLAGDIDDDCDVGFVRRYGVEDARGGPGRVLFVDEFVGGFHPGMGEPLGAGRRWDGAGQGQGGGEEIEGAVKNRRNAKERRCESGLARPATLSLPFLLLED